MEQTILTAKNNYADLDRWLQDRGCKRLFLVCDDSIRYLDAFRDHLEQAEKTGITFVCFRDFQPNPLYESVLQGVALFRAEGCDGILAVGGGSAMDVAKCVKLYYNLPGDGADGAWLQAEYVPNEIPFLAMPTTAGTGSEATRYDLFLVRQFLRFWL